MPKATLPLAERLETASQLVMRTRIFFDIWWLYTGPTRADILDAMNEYPSFFRFDPHAQFVSFVVHICALFETRPDTINLNKLIEESDGQIVGNPIDQAREALTKAAPIVRKAMILRSNLFAHRSSSLSYNEAFSVADVTPDELKSLTESARQIVDLLCVESEIDGPFFNENPQQDLENLLYEISCRCAT